MIHLKSEDTNIPPSVPPWSAGARGPGLGGHVGARGSDVMAAQPGGEGAFCIRWDERQGSNSEGR